MKFVIKLLFLVVFVAFVCAAPIEDTQDEPVTIKENIESPDVTQDTAQDTQDDEKPDEDDDQENETEQDEPQDDLEKPESDEDQPESLQREQESDPLVGDNHDQPESDREQETDADNDQQETDLAENDPTENNDPRNRRRSGCGYVWHRRCNGSGYGKRCCSSFVFRCRWSCARWAKRCRTRRYCPSVYRSRRVCRSVRRRTCRRFGRHIKCSFHHPTVCRDIRYRVVLRCITRRVCHRTRCTLRRRCRRWTNRCRRHRRCVRRRCFIRRHRRCRRIGRRLFCRWFRRRQCFGRRCFYYNRCGYCLRYK